MNPVFFTDQSISYTSLSDKTPIRSTSVFILIPHRKGWHGYSLLLSETLWKHLAEIDEECNEMMDRLVGKMAKKEGVTEQLKSDDWLCWLQKMNSIQSRAEEVVLHDLIYSL